MRKISVIIYILCSIIYMDISEARQRITQSGTTVLLPDDSANADEFYTLIRVYEAVIRKHLQISLKEKSKLIVSISSASAEPINTVYKSSGRTIITLGSSFKGWKTEQKLLDQLMRSMLTSKLESGSESPIPFWIVSALKQAAFRKAHYVDMVHLDLFPALRNLILQGHTPDLETVITSPKLSPDTPLAAIHAQSSYLLLISIPTIRPFLTDSVIPQEQTAGTQETDHKQIPQSLAAISTIVGISTVEDLQEWFEGQIIHRTMAMNSAFAPPSFIKKRLLQIEQITFITKEGKAVKTAIQQLEPHLESIDKKEFNHIKLTFFGKLRNLAVLSQSELTEQFKQLLALQADFTSDDFDDFLDDYNDERKELFKIFDTFSRIESLLKNSDTPDIRKSTKISHHLELIRQIPSPEPPWPLLEKYLEKSEQNFLK